MNKNFYKEITRIKFFDLAKTRREKIFLLLDLAMDSFSMGRILGTGDQVDSSFLRSPVNIQDTGLNFQYINLTSGALASL
ncbi:hypothetical protein KZP23_04495 [Echinicola marina]|uniref:hypothetical protein n=1 Tax=Echinicola marina TaxID=2859768 RepID=UPI001CF6797B|nr:hypothetical protein [Echinicola marina]UCS94295.1 hypothetical protein KZP23_04495 [Echinicola marina]